MNKIITKNSQETHKLGLKLAKKLKKGDILAFIGHLGSGKTTFIKGLAKGLGLKNKITSPTFVWLKTYPLKKNKNYLCHFDFYRLDSSKDFSNNEFEEYFYDPNSICVIEWADKIIKYLPKKTKFIKFNHLDKNKRAINFDKKIKGL
ncbi:MAG: tRNA (adenosine(37)-N6)-threonylcarbamoyltransferase complex ATPase subunit type 1 TsaE [Patescibacteria group bacterium]|nr:tRNA (adenosine(37)-N6)-threonylcarbamoyltransferase complex ATPase subunit type 1 TsaE [Patescibacteria group bacterium]